MKHFAYGSNLSTAQLRDRIGEEFAFACVARLDGYRLTFDKRSSRDGSGKCNISRAPGHAVYGVVFEISDAGMAELDGSEGGYHLETLPVQSISGDEVAACTYIADNPSAEPLRPTKRYLGVVLEGAREHKLPIEHIRSIETVETLD
jgi:gamma-glutamylcyclotransferase